jgi:ribosome biogenesis GTPase A
MLFFNVFVLLLLFLNLERIIATSVSGKNVRHRILKHQESSESEKIALIENVLKERNHFVTKRCGNWKDNYVQKYQELLKKPENERFYLVSIPNLSGE